MSTEKGKGLQDLALTFSSRIGTVLVAILVQMVLARALGPDGRGIYEACLLYGAVLVLIVNFGSEVSTLYLISSSRAPLSAGVVAGMTYALLIALVAFVVGGLVIRFPLPGLEGMFSKATPGLFVLGLVAAQTSVLAETMMAILPAMKRFRMYSALLLGGRVAGLLMVLLLVQLAGQGVSGALNSLVVSRLLVVIIPMVLLVATGVVRLEAPRTQHLRALLQYGSRFYVGKVSNSINFRVGSLVLLLFATRQELGFYGQALAIALNFMVLPDSLYTVLLPRASEDAAGRTAAIAQAGRLILLVGLVSLVGAYFLTAPVFRLLLTEAFLPSVPLFQVLVVGFALRAYGKMFEPYLIGTDRPGRVSVAVALGLAVNVILIVVLMPRLGTVGAAWALVGNYATSTALIVSDFLRHSRISLRQCVVPRGDDLQLLRSLTSRRKEAP